MNLNYGSSKYCFLPRKLVVPIQIPIEVILREAYTIIIEVKCNEKYGNYTVCPTANKTK